MRTAVTAAILILSSLTFYFVLESSLVAQPKPRVVTSSELVPHQNLGSAPSAFTKNMGQWPDSILFESSAGGTTMWFTRNGIWYQFARRITKPTRSQAASSAALGPQRPASPHKFLSDYDSLETTMVKAEFAGASPTAEVLGLGEQNYKCNYFIGDDKSKWHCDVPNYSAVVMKGIYPGVDATFRGQNGRMEYELSGVLEDLAQAKVAYRCAKAIVLQEDGSAAVSTSLGEKSFVGVLPASDDTFDTLSQRTVTISSAESTRVTLVYSTYLGGVLDDLGRGIAIDRSGNAFVTGQTFSPNFPTQNPYQSVLGLGNAVFISKLSPLGNSLIYSTYLGGSAVNYGSGIAIDTFGNVYVVGYTSSSDFPTQNPYQTYQGGIDAFVAKLSAAGDSLRYSTYLGGGGGDYGYGIAVDGMGDAYVTGITGSSNFPLQNPYQSYQGGDDAFVTELSSTGNSLVYSTCLGGTAGDYGYAIALGPGGRAYVTGYTSSLDFPTMNRFQGFQGGDDAFVTALSPSGSGLLYSTFLGGTSGDYGFGIAVDVAGNAYVTGQTYSTDFPTQNPYQSSNHGYGDAFVAKLSPAGSGLIYSTYLGGSADERGCSIAVDSSGNAYLTGGTNSADFPVQYPYQTYQSSDAFVTKLATAGNSLPYSTYLGGKDEDNGFSIAVDANDDAYVTGYTLATNFPTQNPYELYQGGNDWADVFVTKLRLVSCCVGTTGNVNGIGVVDLGDLAALVSYLTGGGFVPPCPAAANVDGKGIIDLGDVSALVSYLTGGGFVLPSCP